MLQTIRNCISNLPDQSFPYFYQDYVTSCQDAIIDKHFQLCKSKMTQLEDVNTIMEGLNHFTEELKKI